MTRPIYNSENQARYLKDVYLGSASGIAAVAVIKPQMYFKNISQAPTQNTKFVMSPLVLYRGTGTFAASFIPTIAIQTLTNSIFSSTLSPLLAASAAGAASAIIVCPAEGILRQQEITGKNFKQAVCHMYSQKGSRAFHRGLLSTSIREGAFAGAYLGAVPVLKEKMKSSGFSETASQVSAGIISGTAAAIISQPFDTYKTQVQSDLFKEVSLRGPFQKGAFLGLYWRISMMATATTIMPFAREKLNNLI